MLAADVISEDAAVGIVVNVVSFCFSASSMRVPTREYHRRYTALQGIGGGMRAMAAGVGGGRRGRGTRLYDPAAHVSTEVKYCFLVS